MKIPIQKGEHSCKRTELSLERKEENVNIKHKTVQRHMPTFCLEPKRDMRAVWRNG